MSQIKITVPNDDHVALRAMAKALEEIAVARGAPAQGKQIGELNYKTTVDTTEATAALGELAKQAEVDTTAQQCESLLKSYEELPPVHDSEQAPPTTDSTGTPWDERIHSASKALNSDGTWRVRRKPADKTPEEWVDYIKWVEEDIHTVQQGGQSDTDTLEEWVEEQEKNGYEEKEPMTEPTVTPAGDDFHVDAGVVTEQEVAAIPAPPLPVPPVPNAETLAAMDELDNGKGQPADEYVTYTFPQVMKFLTERHALINSAQVEQIIREMGLTSIMDLNTQPEHTGPFIARVKAHLGE